MFRNIYLYTYMYAITLSEKEAMNFKQSKEEYIQEGLEDEKGRGK